MEHQYLFGSLHSALWLSLFSVIMGSFPQYALHVSYFLISYSSFGRVYKDTHHLKQAHWTHPSIQRLEEITVQN